MSAVDKLLAEARAGLIRLQPREAAEAQRRGALLVDTRPLEQRRRDGEVPGALAIDRNVLEWRLEPGGQHSIAQLHDSDQVVIVICNEGYSSSFAAASLQRLGLGRATDVIGGMQAWLEQGLPVRRTAE